MAAPNDLIEGRLALLDAQDVCVQANSFYDGDSEEIFSSAKARRLLQKNGALEVEDFNYAHIPVDAIAEKLQIASISAIVGDPEEDEDTADEAAQKTLELLLDENQLDAETPGHLLNTCKHGNAYALVWPRTDDTGNTTGVDIRFNSCESVRMVYSAEDPLKPAYVIKMWEINAAVEDKKQIRINLYYDDRIERWVTEPGRRGDDPKDWIPYNDDELGQALDSLDDDRPVIPHNLGRIPWFHYRTGRPYGTPEHSNAYGPQQLINKLVVAHAATIDFQSFPQRYALVDPKIDQVLSNLVDPDFPEDEDDDPESESNSTTLKADPSAVWRLYGVTGVGQFQVADPKVFIDPFDRYVKAMSEVTGTPLYRFGGSFAQPPSGEALRRIDAPLNTRADHLQRLLGATHKDMLEFALSLAGVTDATVQITWAPVQQVTDAEGWGVVGTKIANGVPPEQALVEAGYERDQVKKWLDEPGNNEMLRRIAVLGQLGDAATKLGTAAGLGVISLEQIGKAIQWVLGAAFVGGDPEDYAEPPTELFEEKEIQPPTPVAMQEQQIDHQAEQADLGRQQAMEIAQQAPPSAPSTQRQPAR